MTAMVARAVRKSQRVPEAKCTVRVGKDEQNKTNRGPLSRRLKTPLQHPQAETPTGQRKTDRAWRRQLAR